MATRTINARKFSEIARSEVGQSLLFVLKEFGLNFDDLASMTENQLTYLFEASRAKAEKEKEESDKMKREMEREKQKSRSSTTRAPRYRRPSRMRR